MLHKHSRLTISIIFLFGFFLGASPDIGLGILVISGILYLLRDPKSFKEMYLFIPPLVLLYFIPSLILQNRIQDLLQIPITILLFIGAKSLYMGKLWKISLILGLTIAIIYALISTFSLIPKLEWVITPELATASRKNNSLRFTAVDKSNAWVLQQLEYQGGDFQYSAEVRADRPILVNMVILHEGLPNGHSDSLCQFLTTWSICKFRVQTQLVRPAMFGFGSHSTWKAGDPVLEVRNSQIKVISPPSLLERIKAAPRTQGTSFNANAFGAWMAVIGLIAVTLNTQWWWKILIICPPLIGILLSGSRNALFAFAIGSLVLIIAQNHFTRGFIIFGILIVAIFSTQIWLITHEDLLKTPYTIINFREPQPIGTRALDVLDLGGIQTRLAIFRLAFRTFLTSPWVGVSDLRMEMIKRLDIPAKNAGLTSENISHSHNLWLQIAGERGLIGLFGMIWLWGLVINSTWQRRDALSLSLLSVIFLLNNVDYFFYYAPIHIAFWLCAAGFLINQSSSRFLKQHINDKSYM